MNPIEKLEALQHAYRQELPEKIFQIQNLFKKHSVEGFDSESFTLFHRLIHNLVGSGATFGMIHVSESAQILDNLLKPFISEGKIPSKKEMETLIMPLRSLASVSQIQTDGMNPKISDRLTLPYTNQSLRKKHETVSIYLIDDEHHIHEELKTQLENFGYPVSSFFDTKSFEIAVKKKVPDVVLMDVMFPYNNESGIGSIRHIRKEISKNFVLFFISGKDDFKTRVDALRVGSDGFITKPVDIGLLVNKLDHLTEKVNLESIRVLLLDDEASVAEFHASILNAVGIEALCINDPDKILEVMAEYRPDLILTDLYMPNYSGLDVAKVIRQMDEYMTIPIIYLSVESDETVQSDALCIGAEDFMVKPVNPEELIRRIKNKAERYRSLREQIQHDSLTGLYNHTIITNMLAKAVADAKRYKHALSFVMIDVDNFKHVNDTYGHQTGDNVLKTLSHLLQQRVRDSDSVGRYGGEEFCIILPHTRVNDAHQLIDDIRLKFSKIIQLKNNNEFYTSFSAGICQWNETMDVTTLIEHADKAMYRAKLGGRNQVMLSNSE